MTRLKALRQKFWLSKHEADTANVICSMGGSYMDKEHLRTMALDVVHELDQQPVVLSQQLVMYREYYDSHHALETHYGGIDAVGYKAKLNRYLMARARCLEIKVIE